MGLSVRTMDSDKQETVEVDVERLVSNALCQDTADGFRRSPTGQTRSIHRSEVLGDSRRQ